VARGKRQASCLRLPLDAGLCVAAYRPRCRAPERHGARAGVSEVRGAVDGPDPGLPSGGAGDAQGESHDAMGDWRSRYGPGCRRPANICADVITAPHCAESRNGFLDTAISVAHCVTLSDMTAARQFSARLDADVVDRLERRGARSGLNKSRLAERYIDEGVRMDDHPGIVFRDGPIGRRAGLAAGPDVWEIIGALRSSGLEGDEANVTLTFSRIWVTVETGEIVLVRDDLRDVVTAIKLSAYAMRKIKQNLFWAFVYNTLGIPIAAGVLFPFTGFLLSPIIAGAAMAFSSVSVVTNSLLMRRFKV